MLNSLDFEGLEDGPPSVAASDVTHNILAEYLTLVRIRVFWKYTYYWVFWSRIPNTSNNTTHCLEKQAKQHVL